MTRTLTISVLIAVLFQLTSATVDLVWEGSLGRPLADTYTTPYIEPLITDGITVYNPQLLKLKGGFIYMFVAIRNGIHNLEFRYFGAELSDDFTVGHRKILCLSEQPILNYRLAAAPTWAYSFHVIYDFPDDWRQQVVVVFPDITKWVYEVKGGFCGDRDDDHWNDEVPINPQSPYDPKLERTVDITMSAMGSVAMVTRWNGVGAWHYPLALISYNATRDEDLIYLHPMDDGRYDYFTITTVSDNPNQEFMSPRIAYTGINNYVVVWEAVDYQGIWARVFSHESAIPLTEYFEVTAGMERTHHSHPEIIPDRLGSGFIVTWREMTDAVTTVWMREFDGLGNFPADNPNPHVVYSSPFESFGMKPVGSSTFGGQAWISFLWPSKSVILSVLMDFDGTVWDQSPTPVTSSMEAAYEEYATISQTGFGILNLGFALTLSTSFTDGSVLSRLDYINLGGYHDWIIKPKRDFQEAPAEYFTYLESLTSAENPYAWAGDDDFRQYDGAYQFREIGSNQGPDTVLLRKGHVMP